MVAADSQRPARPTSSHPEARNDPPSGRDDRQSRGLLAKAPRGADEQARVKLSIDASVMVTAAFHGPSLYTSDFDDMIRLQDLGSFNVRVFNVGP
jgi:hypothetical protein